MTSFFGDFEARCPKTRPCRIKILHLSFAVPDNNALVLVHLFAQLAQAIINEALRISKAATCPILWVDTVDKLCEVKSNWQTLFNWCGSQGEFATHCNNSQDQKSKEKVNDAGMMLRWKKKSGQTGASCCVIAKRHFR